jgi:hypothetical protein
MAIPARELISRAYYLSQVVSRELQTVSGDQITDGLYLLNALLDFKSTDTRLIPYYDRTTFNTIAGTEVYFRPNLLMVDAITFNIGDVRYSMTEMTRDGYFATARVDNIQSLPFSYRVERVLGGANIYLYFVPADVYVMNLSAKYALSEVTLDQDISLVYDKYYIEYLRHELANMICSDYGATLPDATMQTLQEYRKKLLAVSPPDLSIQSDNYFDSGYGFDWQMVNLYKGYVPF